MGVIGVLIERFAYRPLRNAPRLAPLITAIGVSFILQNIVQLVSTAPPTTAADLPGTPGRRRSAARSIPVLEPVHHRRRRVLMVAPAAVRRRTRLGRAMRSTAHDRDAAAS